MTLVDERRPVYRSLRLLPVRTGVRWVCRSCGDGSKIVHRDVESATSAWLAHVRGPEHAAAVSCEAVARQVVRIVLGS